jgi:histidinol phosphatase-like enzyme (inositol monophosphatase family)
LSLVTTTTATTTPAAHADAPMYLDFALTLAQRAGDVILPHFRQPIVIDDKGGARGYDPVTAADRGAETVIRDGIAHAYPTHGIFGEEHGYRAGTSPYTWVIDPIDGTRSFILGQMHWATLIALRDDTRPIVGVAHQPYVGESFVAIAGGTAEWRRGDARRVLRTRGCASVGDAVLACTTPDMFATLATQAGFSRVRSRARLTRFGGDCYAYCLLAMGLIDIVVESSLKAYDVQALMPIVEGAGGVITTWRGERCDDGGDVVACGDPALHPRVMELLAG